VRLDDIATSTVLSGTSALVSPCFSRRRTWCGHSAHHITSACRGTTGFSVPSGPAADVVGRWRSDRQKAERLITAFPHSKEGEIRCCCAPRHGSHRGWRRAGFRSPSASLRWLAAYLQGRVVAAVLHGHAAHAARSYSSRFCLRGRRRQSSRRLRRGMALWLHRSREDLAGVSQRVSPEVGSVSFPYSASTVVTHTLLVHTIPTTHSALLTLTTPVPQLPPPSPPRLAPKRVHFTHDKTLDIRRPDAIRGLCSHSATHALAGGHPARRSIRGVREGVFSSPVGTHDGSDVLSGMALVPGIRARSPEHRRQRNPSPPGGPRDGLPRRLPGPHVRGASAPAVYPFPGGFSLDGSSHRPSMDSRAADIRCATTRDPRFLHPREQVPSSCSEKREGDVDDPSLPSGAALGRLAGDDPPPRSSERSVARSCSRRTTLLKRERRRAPASRP
jgi:hypothetical protein